MSRAASSSKNTATGTMKETLQSLMEAADHFVNSLPRSKKTDKERRTLLKAITQAQQLLATEPSAEE